MLLLLSSYFQVKLPAVFFYTSTRMILAAISSLLLSILLGPAFIRKLYSLKIGQNIRKEDCPLLGHLHRNKENTPTMGGILILASMLISLFLWMDLTNVFTLILASTTLCLGSVGALDDYLKLKYRNSKGLASRYKFFFQLVFSFFLALFLLSTRLQSFFPKIIAIDTLQTTTLHLNEYISLIYIPFYKYALWQVSSLGYPLLILFFLIVICGSSNAVNLTDGLDGLAAGCLILVASCLAVFAFISNHYQTADYLNMLYIEGSGEIAIYLCAFAGACLGFLWYNSYPAQVFMGDTGSLALGGVLGVSAILLRKEFLLALVGATFVIETLSVIIQVSSYKLRNKKRVFLCSPLHHHFEYKGYLEPKIVVRFWIASLLLAVIGLASIKFQ